MLDAVFDFDAAYGDDDPVHLIKPDSDPLRAWCGVRLAGEGTHLPEDEVTDEAWCAACLAAERLAHELTG